MASASGSAAGGVPAAGAPRSMLLARRPGNGTIGRRITVLSNHFLVRFQRKKLYHYDVTISPDAPRFLKRDIINTMVKQHRGGKLGDNLPVYDGENSLYTANAIGENVELDVEIDDEKRRKRAFRVTLREAARPDLGLLEDFLNGRTTVFPQETVQVLDVILRESAANAKALVAGGRSFFGHVIGVKDLGGGIVAWRGFYMSMRPAQNGFLTLNVDMTGNAFIKQQPVLDFLGHSFRADPRDLDRELRRPDAQGDAYRVKVKKLLKGLKVETSHAPSKRTYKITNLSRQPLEDLRFEMNGEQMSVVDYFRQKYNKELAFKGFPVLDCSRGKKCYIPLELCRIVSGQNFTRRLNENQRNGLSAMTCCKPEERKNATLEAIKSLKEQSKEYTQHFGVQINNLLTSVPARVLPPPKIQYRNGEISPNNGTWNMINKRMMEGREIKHWGIVNFSSRVREQDVDNITKELSRSCSLYGMAMSPHLAFRPMHITNLQRVEEGLRAAVGELRQKKSPDLQLLICIMPSSENKGFYVTVKRLCELELGVVTQCAKDEQIKKCRPPYLANLILKINGKLGGKNAVLSIQDQKKCRLISESPTLIIGADVSHPRPGDDCSTSMAAVVASMDWPGFAQYETVVRSQPSRQEMLDDLFWEQVDEQGRKQTGGIFKDILLSFQHRTNFIPHRIIYYRDGVSEGQFEAVLRSELESLKRACDALGWAKGPAGSEPSQKRSRVPDEGPKVTFIVVQKKHHTCFFPDRPSGNQQNISPGTIVDTTVCHPTNFDFYLCSHQGIKGTSRAAHYHVLKDENGFSADEIQQFTHDMCYMYSRCTRAVSVVPPCYYAHLAAKRAQAWVDPEGSSAPGSSVGGGGGGSSTGGGAGRSSTAGSSGRARRSGPPAPVRPLPPLHANIKNTMFYI